MSALAPETAGALVLGAAGLLLLVFAWLVGVQGRVGLITNVRARPECFPDKAGIGRWMGWTLAAGGLSLDLCAAALATGAFGKDAVGVWAGVTGAAIACVALAGVARYRRPPPKGAGAAR